MIRIMWNEHRDFPSFLEGLSLRLFAVVEGPGPCEISLLLGRAFIEATHGKDHSRSQRHHFPSFSGGLSLRPAAGFAVQIGRAHV